MWQVVFCELRWACKGWGVVRLCDMVGIYKYVCCSWVESSVVVVGVVVGVVFFGCFFGIIVMCHWVSHNIFVAKSSGGGWRQLFTW